MASDRIFGLVAALLALAYIASATQIEASFLSDPVGPKSFPIGIGAIGAICAIYMVLKPDPNPDWPTLRTFAALGVAIIFLVFYAYALGPLGFLLPTAAVAAVLSYQISSRPLKSLLTGLGLSAGLFVLFKFALGLGLIAWPKFMVG